jgi:hypothetical protein
VRLNTANTRVLIKSTWGENWHGRGLRQGDPVSPILFISILDALNRVFCIAEEKGLLQSLHRWEIRHRLSLFADYAVMFQRPENK